MRAGRLWGMGLAALLLFGGICKGQDSLYVSRLSQMYDFWEHGRDVVISGNYAYVATGWSGLKILDISNPVSPAIIGSCETAGIDWSIAQAGAFVYLGDTGGALRIIDASNPQEPQEVGTCYVGDWVAAMAISGNYAYLAGWGGGGLRVIDISDAISPTEVAFCSTYGYGDGVAVSGDYAYLTNGSDGLVVVDISEPQNPFIIGSCPTPSWATAVAVSGDYAYVTNYEYGVCVVDVSNPLDPNIAGSCATWRDPRGIAISGYYAYVADGENGFSVVSIVNPGSPVLVGHCAAPSYAKDVAVSGDYAYVANYDQGIRIINIANPSAPFVDGLCNSYGDIRRVAVSGDYAYLSDSRLGLHIVDISNPLEPMEMSTLAMPSYVACVDIIEGLAYWACGPEFLIMDLSNPIQPAQIGFYASQNMIFDGTIQGNYAYLANNNSGLLILDISNPSIPVEIGHCALNGGFAHHVAVSGGYAYLVGYPGLWIVNVSDPAAPILEATLIASNTWYDIAVRDSLVYIPTGNGRQLLILNVSNPQALLTVGEFDVPNGAPNLIELSGNYAILGDPFTGIWILDISNPENPVARGQYQTVGLPQSLALQDTLIYVAEWFYFSIYGYSTAILEPAPLYPSTFALYPPHPNPFNPTTILSFDLPVAGLVKLEVFDINGRQTLSGSGPEGGLRSATPTMYPAGTHHIPFDGSGLPSGIYLARLTAGDFSAVQKLVLLR